MAATSQPLATQVALDILKLGGNAIDAAIAANACLALMEPTGCGLGGDLFAMVWDAKEQRLCGLNASGRSPRSLTLEHLQSLGLKKIPQRGPLPISVPGCVDGWFELHGRFGSLPMKTILAPAIHYAREGFPVTQLIAYYWQLSADLLRGQPGFAEQFLIDGRAPRAGEIFTNPHLAKTLEALAEGGRDAFYRGDIARQIAAAVASAGGFLSYEDLQSHSSDWVDALSVDYRGYRVYELPPNGQGIAALQMLNILEGYDIASMGFGSADYIHVFIEAKKLAFEDRARFCADPAFTDAPIEGLLSDDYAQKRRELIRLDEAQKDFSAGNPALEEGDTIYLTTADGAGNMVSLIQSNFRGMGSGIAPSGLGFILQDRGELFDVTPGRPNTYAPEKRPFHTIIPGFVCKDGKPLLSFGVMGGDLQPQAHVQIVVNIVDFGMSVQEAGDAPRIYHEGSSEPTGEPSQGRGRLYLETGISYDAIRELSGRGHDIGFKVGAFGGYQAILRDEATGVYHGASESRKDGQAAGF